MPEENKKSESLGEKLKETNIELKKVHWPTKKELFNYTMITIATVIFFSVAIYLIDSGLGFIIAKVIGSK